MSPQFHFSNPEQAMELAAGFVRMIPVAKIDEKINDARGLISTMTPARKAWSEETLAKNICMENTLKVLRDLRLALIRSDLANNLDPHKYEKP